jgi:hypothetical protein
MCEFVIMQKVGVGEDGCVDLLEFAYRIKQRPVCGGKRIQVFSATIVGGQL